MPRESPRTYPARSRKAHPKRNAKKPPRNWKQLALGVHNYESAHGHFPPAGRGYGWCSSQAGGSGDPVILNMSGWVLVLPFIEQAPMYQLLDLNQSFSQQAAAYCCGFTGNANGSLSGNPATNVNGRMMDDRHRHICLPI
ncbi:MAG: DUF1559 domain-containing protein [Planctomycetes bacterium]|nr:DUF1559 domain-containing protein [Planctomycetota bacterium]